VAQALDPSSVVKDSEAGMVIDAQGLDAATLGRLNSMLGGAALMPQQRLELLALVKRRADSLRKVSETRRRNIIDISGGIVDERLLRPLPMLPEIAPPEQVSTGGRTDRQPFPEPELIEVR
jgi:hypothetical protein